MAQAALGVVLTLGVLAAAQPVRDAVGTEDQPATVEPAPPEIAAEIVVERDVPARFYPLVVDGYKDHATLSWRLHPAFEQWQTTVKVLTPSGGQRTDFRLPANATDFTWDGRDDRGRPLPAGDYRLEVEVVAERPGDLTRGTVAMGLVRPIEVATRRYVDTETTVISAASLEWGVKAMRGYCAYKPERTNAMLFDCDDSGYLQIGADVPLPDGARIRGEAFTGKVKCCWPGSVDKWWSRTEAGGARFNLRVTGDRRYRLQALTVEYDVRVEL